MMRNRTLTIQLMLITMFTLMIFFATVPTANATSAGLSIDKGIMDIELPIGLSESNVIQVGNNSTSTPLPVHVDLLLWNLKEDVDDIEFVRAEDALNATKWFDVSQTDFILDPGDSRDVEFTIAPPKDAPPGSYFVMMRFQPRFPEFYFEEEGPRFLPEIGSLFFIKVPIFGIDGEQEFYGATIESIEPLGVSEIPFAENFLPRANAGVFDEALDTVIARVRNNGIFHFRANGSIVVKNVFGRTVAEVDMPKKFLLPGRSRSIDVELLPPIPEKTDSFFINSARSISHLWRTNAYFGPYSATVTLYVPSNLPIIETINFWIIPWKLLSILGILIFGSIFIVRKFGKRILVAIKVLASSRRHATESIKRLRHKELNKQT